MYQSEIIEIKKEIKQLGSERARLLEKIKI